MGIMRRLRYKVVRIENVIEVWLKLNKYLSRVQDYDSHTEIYTSTHLECNRCGKIKYHKDDLLYLDLLKNKGYCIDCILEFGVKHEDVERDKSKFKTR